MNASTERQLPDSEGSSKVRERVERRSTSSGLESVRNSLTILIPRSGPWVGCWFGRVVPESLLGKGILNRLVLEGFWLDDSLLGGVVSILDLIHRFITWLAIGQFVVGDVAVGEG
jgi:hypothetical protein